MSDEWQRRYEMALSDVSFHFRDAPRTTDVFGRTCIRVHRKVYERDKFLRACARIVAHHRIVYERGDGMADYFVHIQP